VRPEDEAVGDVDPATWAAPPLSLPSADEHDVQLLSPPMGGSSDIIPPDLRAPPRARWIRWEGGGNKDGGCGGGGEGSRVRSSGVADEIPELVGRAPVQRVSSGRSHGEVVASASSATMGRGGSPNEPEVTDGKPTMTTASGVPLLGAPLSPVCLPP
jgi:hypothetical protein